MPRKSSINVGDSKINYQGILMTIKDWYDCNHMIVEFEDGCIREIFSDGNARWRKGNIRSFNVVATYGKGYLGGDKYNSKEHEFVYKTWNHMLERCYTEKYHKRFPTYIDCSVCDEWLNFQNFAEWYYNNVWNDNFKESKLDKDILVKGNKVYSPQTCILVDNNINCLFTKCDKTRGGYPIGVSEDNRTHQIRAQVFRRNGIKSTKYVPRTNSRDNDILTAFNWYKESKEQYIKEVADSYKAKYPNFPQKLYDALYNYEVEITD